MSDSCYQLNPLQRQGTSQSQRTLPSLLPDYISIDERDIGDLICFADNYGKLLAYYDDRNQFDGDWQNFIKFDLSTILAKLAQVDPQVIQVNYQEAEDNLRQALTWSNYKTLFDLIFDVFVQIEEINVPTILNTPIKDDLEQEIEGSLKYQLQKFIAYEKGARELIGTTGSPFDDRTTELSQKFNLSWIVQTEGAPEITSWKDYYQQIDANIDIYGNFIESTVPGDVSDGEKIAQSIDYSFPFVEAIFNTVYETYIRLIDQAKVYLQESLTNYPRHKAHNALLLAFFHLFAYIQADLNKLTEKHLDFYFGQVLQLQKKPAQPDSVYLLVQLAKNQQDGHLIKAGTQLKAGKDNTGKNLIYQVDNDLVVNQAQVTSLKTIFVDTDSTQGGVFDAPIANSQDGLGGKFIDPNQTQWRGFGQSQLSLNSQKITMQRSSLGLAIAAPILLLQQGRRIITFKFEVEGGVAPNINTALRSHLQVAFSGAEDWIQAATLDSNNDNLDNYVRYTSSPSSLEIKVTLSPEQEAVVNYDAENLVGGFPTTYPVAKIELVTDSVTNNLYKSLQNLKITKITINTRVEGLSNLVLQNDNGVVDPSKPFFSFGVRPQIGSRFYIGSQEAFSKKLTALNLDLEWTGLPLNQSFHDYYTYKDKAGTEQSPYVAINNNADFKAIGAFLEQGVWRPLQVDVEPLQLEQNTLNAFLIFPLFAGSTNFLSGAGGLSTSSELGKVSLFPKGTDEITTNGSLKVRLSFDSTDLPSTDNPNLELFSSYKIDAQDGFLRLTLNNPSEAFGHAKYPKVYAEQIIALSSFIANSSTLPNEPYTPTLQSLVIHYTAEKEIDLTANSDRPEQLFSLHPFGYRQLTETKPFLLPQFNHQDENGNTLNIQGALYIGIQNTQLLQNISLLFRVAEGTEDPSKDSPTVVWSYLEQNQWFPLKDKLLADDTQNLLKSGIVTVQIPVTANDDNTLLPVDHYWLRVSIPSNTQNLYQAFPQLIDVQAQALKATFADQDNDPEHLATPLPANTISKLVQSDSAVKKISQPDDSFSGRMIEESARFYVRVSERLRHKQRAITIWDYERLVLEAFPSLYQVKCLNHTNDDTELMPGSVRLVVIPNLQGQTAGDKFAPQVSNATLEAIKDFLTATDHALCNPFIDLKVENPRYEAIKVNCQVAFYPDQDPLFAQKQLSQDLEKWLAPWAFNQDNPIEFGGSLHQSQIIKFMENLAYVDFIKDFYLHVYEYGNITPFLSQVSEVQASTSRSILTSYRSPEDPENSLSHNIQIFT